MATVNKKQSCHFDPVEVQMLMCDICGCGRWKIKSNISPKLIYRPYLFFCNLIVRFEVLYSRIFVTIFPYSR